MSFQLSDAGAASQELARNAQEWWQDAAAKNNIDLAGFDPEAPLSERIAWALRVGLLIAAIYSRFSSKLQHSTADQIRECIFWAARNGMYIAPEFISVDEAVSGKRVRRDGLERMKSILKARQATVLLVFKASRLFRQSYKGFQLIQQEVVEERLRAVSVSQGIDTDDKKTWKLQLQIHGIMDEMLLDAIADHVRAGLTGLFLNGWVTGAVGVGYCREELPNAPVTNRGLPRTVPKVDPDAAELIRRHADLHLGGMSLKEGWRRWIAAGGPYDPRSTTGRMSYNAYRRLWSNIRLTGRWEFGRKRNDFSTKLDYVQQVEQPDDEVAVFQCEELRILEDETFLALQKWLQEFKSGPRGPRRPKPVLLLWDLTTDLFHCAACSTPDAPVRFYQTGANGKGMQCKNGDLCLAKSAVRREDAVRAICEKLAELIVRDSQLVEDVVCRSQEIDAQGDEELRNRIASLENTIRKLSHRIGDLFELAGDGSEDDRKDVQSRIRSAQTERAATQLDLTRLKKVLEGSTATLTREDVRTILMEMSAVLTNAAAGELGEEAVYKALAVLRRLTGGRIWVHVECRKGRKRTNVRGVFQLQLVQAIHEQSDFVRPELPDNLVSVWLRKPPRIDVLAERVRYLIEVEGRSHRETAKVLRQEGHHVNAGNVWYSYRRWYEMQGQTPPNLPYNNGHTRRSRNC